MAKPLHCQLSKGLAPLSQMNSIGVVATSRTDASGLSVFPTSANAVKRCGLGAVIAAAYQLTRYDAANELAHKLSDHSMARPHLCMSMT